MPRVEFSSIPAQEKMVNVHIHNMLNCKFVHVCADLGIVVGERGGGRSSVEKKTYHSSVGKMEKVKRGSRGGGGDRGVLPPGKSQVIWGSIGDKQLDPSLEKVGPPSPRISWTPSETLKIDLSLKLTI